MLAVQVQLDLVANRDDLLAGLCAQLGVDEAAATAGQLAAGGVARAAPLAVQFAGENAVGDGVRREWFNQVAGELLQPDCGLFLSKDGGRTLQVVTHPRSQLLCCTSD